MYTKAAICLNLILIFIRLIIIQSCIDIAENLWTCKDKQLIYLMIYDLVYHIACSQSCCFCRVVAVNSLAVHAINVVISLSLRDHSVFSVGVLLPWVIWGMRSLNATFPCWSCLSYFVTCWERLRPLKLSKLYHFYFSKPFPFFGVQ
jgi:hypothetical protein